MASAKNEERLKQPVALRVLIVHLGSWRYLAALSLPPLIFVLTSPMRPETPLLLLLILLVHYLCWRLWLDERLFRLLPAGHDDLAAFDAALRALWGGAEGAVRPLAHRWAGARRLLRRALAATLGLWAVWLLVLLWRHG